MVFSTSIRVSDYPAKPLKTNNKKKLTLDIQYVHTKISRTSFRYNVPFKLGMNCLLTSG